MNIFDYYYSSLLKGLKDFEKKGAIKIPEKTNSISVEVPPDKFDADISTNVCMVLSGINKSKPKDIYENYVSKLLSKDDNFCLLYTSPSPRDSLSSRMPSSA